jgi:hypothetical protein
MAADGFYQCFWVFYSMATPANVSIGSNHHPRIGINIGDRGCIDLNHNEWDSKLAGTTDWRKTIEIQRGDRRLSLPIRVGQQPRR